MKFDCETTERGKTNDFDTWGRQILRASSALDLIHIELDLANSLVVEQPGFSTYMHGICLSRFMYLGTKLPKYHHI